MAGLHFHDNIAFHDPLLICKQKLINAVPDMYMHDCNSHYYSSLRDLIRIVKLSANCGTRESHVPIFSGTRKNVM